MPTIPTPNRIEGDAATEAALKKVRPKSRDVLEAITRSAGDVLMYSKVPATKKAEIANGIMALAETFGELDRAAWGAES